MAISLAPWKKCPFLKDKLKYGNTAIYSEPPKHKKVELELKDPWVDYLNYPNKLFLCKVTAVTKYSSNPLCENEELPILASSIQ